MENKPYYNAFVAQTPDRVLQDVFENEEPILIGVSLTNGLYAEGIVLDVKEDENQQKTVCILSSDEQVSYLNTHVITLVTIKQPKKMAVALSKGAISRPITTDDNELTVLQLKRWLNTEKVKLGYHVREFNIDTIALDQLDNRLNVQDVFRALENVIAELTKDKLGQDAWQSINIVMLEQATNLNVNIQADTLTISLAIDRALPNKLSKILEDKLLQKL